MMRRAFHIPQIVAACGASPSAATPPLPSGTSRRHMMDLPSEGAMHRPGESSDAISSDGDILGKETWQQFAAKVRHGRRRIRVMDITAKMSYEYQMLKKLCKRRPAMRQWSVRDDFCDMSPGVVVMSPSMQAAFMKVFRLKDKASIRRCLRDVIPIIEYRNREEKPLSRDPDKMIPENEADTLNQKKRELFERKEKDDNMRALYLHDHESQAKLRRKIRQRLTKFQRQLAVANAVASRTVLYSEEDSIGYFLFRGPAMYAGVHRVLFELSKMLPHFVPKSMLDFGAGTGTAILVAKEVYDPGALAYPLYRSLRQTMSVNASAEAARMEELRFDLKRLERNNEEKKKARFMAVAALLEKGEIDGRDLPESLRKEIAEVARRAAEAKKARERRATQSRHRDVVDGTEWTDEDPIGLNAAMTEDAEDVLPGEEPQDGDADSKASKGGATWWERLVDSENANSQAKAARRLRPLQEITAIEPSPGMMEIGVMVLHDDVPNVQWKRYMMPEDETISHDLVIAAYSLSEVAEPEQRTRLVKQLWKMTKGVLILVEFASLSNFDMLMKARDTILEEKGVGLWDWQPTIVGPCPHEKECPLRYSKVGVRRKKLRVCNTEVQYKATFVEVWARHLPLKVGIEPISYMIFARNEMVPDRAEKRKAEVAKQAREAVQNRAKKQQEFHDAATTLHDAVFERLSEEALAVPNSGGSPLPLDPDSPAAAALAAATAGDVTSTGEVGHPVNEETRIIRTTVNRETRLTFPLSYPPAVHRFNRAFIDAGYQRQRAISPTEMLTVRNELNDMRSRFLKEAPKYYRLIQDPKRMGKIGVDLCCPDGELIHARVYRRFYGDRSTVSTHTTMRWQHIGGWKLLKRIRKGSLFPHNVPLYAVSKYARISQPNTLVGKDLSHVEATAMQLDDPMKLLETPDEELDTPQRKKKAMTQRDMDQMASADRQIESLFGAKIATGGSSSGSIHNQVSTRQAVTAEQWAEAVERAKRRVVRHNEKAIPNSAKLRQLTKRFRDRAKGERALNRRR